MDAFEAAMDRAASISNQLFVADCATSTGDASAIQWVRRIMDTIPSENLDPETAEEWANSQNRLHEAELTML
jgi:acetyl-CoA carboxylase carboxyltransferase component